MAPEPKRNLLTHLVLVVDGSSRWAHQRGYSQFRGYLEAIRIVGDLLRVCEKHDVRYITFHTISLDNFGRTADEIKPFQKAVGAWLKLVRFLYTKKYRFKFLWDPHLWSPEIIKAIKRVEQKSSLVQGTTIIVTLGYSSRPDILQAIEKIIAQDPPPQQVTEEYFRQYLQTADIPDPDFLIRPGGEKRLSNFLLYELAYTELYFTDVLWPDFTGAMLEEALAEYYKRDRRHGLATKST